MAVGGSVQNSWLGGVGPPQDPTSLFGNPASFTAAAKTQASDYDKIMAEYDNLIKTTSANPISAGVVPISQVSQPQQVNPSQIQSSSLTPQTAKYSQSGDVTSSLAGLSDLATTGGYTAQGIADIRARDISPTRSIYANAQQNVERAKALDGGYSPNFNATQAKMARDESSQIGDITTNANAGIAQNVASNRIAAAPAYASASAGANAAQTAADQRNADIVNQINALNEQNALQTQEFNAQGTQQAQEFNTSTAAAIAEANANRATSTGLANTQNALSAAQLNRGTTQGAISGQTSLYGTTPALTQTFGNQVVQASQLGQGQQVINNNKLGTMFGAAAR